MKQMHNHWRGRLAALLLTLALLLSTTAWAGFADVPEDSAEREAIEWAFDSGVALGVGDNSFRPDAPCTRAALATFLWRMNGAPDMGADTAWWSDAAAWAVQEGLFESAEGMNEPIGGAEFASVMASLGASVDGGASVTRGRAIRAVYALAAAQPTLDDGDPWVDYCLRENIARVAAKPDTPKDDFYLYNNYEWAKTVEIKPGYQSESTSTEVADEIKSMGMAVLTDKTLTGADAKLVRQLYDAYLDWDARNALGVKPAQETIDRIKAVSTLDELTALFCDENSGVAQLFGFGASTGFNDSETYLLAVDAMGLYLGDSAEYARRTEQGERYEAAYRAAATKLFPKFGYSAAEADAMMDRAFALETELATGIMTSADMMSPDYYQRVNNEMDRAGAEQLAGAFPWLRIADAWGYSAARRYLVRQPDYFKALDAVYAPERLDDLKNYLIVCEMFGSMSFLDRECYEISVELGNAKGGSTGSPPDEEAAFETVRGALTTPMDRAFLAKYDASKMKADITRICEEAIAYYRTMLQSEDWLSEATRAKAIEKLDAITINAVYPDKWLDYSGLSLDGLGYCDCLQEIGKFNQAYNISLLGTKVDRTLWSFDILEPNAFYGFADNSISIIRGILGGAFYREDMSNEELYAAIGVVIGHEITHAFDPNGAQFDAQGNMNDWWTEEDHAAFTARAEKLAAYYDAMTAFGGYRVQGKNIQGEAIADMAGVKCMLGLLEQKGDVDYDAFFTAYAKVWRKVLTKEFDYFALMQDPHPLSYLRLNATLQQFEQFYKTYDIREGDGMYLAPENRVMVW